MPMLLSISRHRPSARGAPLQSPILSADIYDSTLTIVGVKHFRPPVLDPFVDRSPPAGGYSLGFELSRPR
jgi:hypothetical protein